MFIKLYGCMETFEPVYVTSFERKVACSRRSDSGERHEE